jgi:WD40 repeat protein
MAGLLLLNTFDTALYESGPVVFSPDGTCFASGSECGKIQVWDVSSGIERLTWFRPHDKRISSVAFSPNGARIASSSDYSKLIIVWDKISNKKLLTMDGHTRSVNSVAFSPDGLCIVSGSKDDTIRVWDSISGNALRVLSGHLFGVTSVVFSPNGRHIISGSDDRTVRIWDDEPPGMLAVQHIQDASLLLEMSPDGTRILSGGYNGQLQMWDGPSGTQLRIQEVGSGVYAVKFSPDGAYFISLSCVYDIWSPSVAFGLGSTSIQMWDSVSGERMWVSEIPLFARNVAFLDDGRHFEVWNDGSSADIARYVTRLEVSTGLGICSRRENIMFDPEDFRDSCYSFNSKTGCIERGTPLSATVVCYIPRGFSVWNYCFRGNVGVLSLASGEIVILEIPQ